MYCVPHTTASRRACPLLAGVADGRWGDRRISQAWPPRSIHPSIDHSIAACAQGVEGGTKARRMRTHPHPPSHHRSSGRCCAFFGRGRQAGPPASFRSCICVPRDSDSAAARDSITLKRKPIDRIVLGGCRSRWMDALGLLVDRSMAKLGRGWPQGPRPEAEADEADASLTGWRLRPRVCTIPPHARSFH